MRDLCLQSILGKLLFKRCIFPPAGTNLRVANSVTLSFVYDVPGENTNNTLSSYAAAEA